MGIKSAKSNARNLRKQTVHCQRMNEQTEDQAAVANDARSRGGGGATSKLFCTTAIV
jgi:hypothetical protein